MSRSRKPLIVYKNRKPNPIQRLAGWILRVEGRIAKVEQLLELPNSWPRKETGLPNDVEGILQADQLHDLLARVMMRLDDIEKRIAQLEEGWGNNPPIK